MSCRQTHPASSLEVDKLMKPLKLGEIIAERKLVAIKGRKKVEVIVKLGRPLKIDHGPGFRCPIQIKGIGDEKVRFAAGEDSMQSIQLAMKMIGIELFLRNKDYQFSWLDQPDAGFIKPSDGLSLH
jgi:uncharacterized protein DUF6968